MHGGGKVPRVVRRTFYDGQRLNIPIRWIYCAILVSFFNVLINMEGRTISSATVKMTVMVSVLALVGFLNLRYQRRVAMGEIGEDGHFEEGDERYLAVPVSFIRVCIFSWLVYLMVTDFIVLFAGIIVMCYAIIMSTF